VTRVQVFRIGPLDGIDRRLYVPSSSLPLQVVDAASDEEGLRQIIQQRPDADFVVAPDLSDAARQLGLLSATLDDQAEVMRVTVALKIALEDDWGAISGPWVVDTLLCGCADFLTARFVSRWPVKMPLEVELKGDVEVRLSGAIVAEPHPGLVLFVDPMAAKGFVVLAADERASYLESHDHRRVSLEPAPRYAAEWLQHFYSIDCMPRLAVWQGGTRAVVANDDALILGGTLRALSQIREPKDINYAITQTPGRTVRTFVAPGDPWPFLYLP
jgi:hypothetical protein